MEPPPPAVIGVVVNVAAASFSVEEEFDEDELVDDEDASIVPGIDVDVAPAVDAAAYFGKMRVALLPLRGREAEEGSGDWGAIGG